MNEFVYKLTLDLNCAKTPPVICSGQFDKGRKFEFTITANGEPYDVTGCSAVLKGVRTDGSHFAVECSVSNGKIVKILDDTTLSVRGKTVAKLVVSDSTKSYSTQMFIIDVDSSLDGNITVTDDYSILNRLIEQIHALNESGAIIIDDTINNNSNNAVANKAVAIALAQKSDKSATYTKNEVDTALATKADKTEIDTALATKPSFDDVYTVEEADDHFLSKHDAGNTYATKAELVTKANKVSTYTKAEVDTALSGKLDDAEGSVKRENIEVNAVGTDEIDSGAVDTVNIADKSVTIAKLSDDLLNYIKTSSGAGGGKSAYDIAVDNGYTGTQAEWLASLKGSDYVLTDADKTDIANIVINEYENSIMAVLGVDENATE